MLEIGDARVTWLEGGVFELDAGTMFGVVPRVLWEKKITPLPGGYIRLRAAPLLITMPGGERVVIETGLGNRLTEKQREIFHIKRDWAVPESLAALGLKREDIDYVVLTHLDFDHAGGITMQAEDGDSHELTFPRALHVVQAEEWHDALNPNRRSKNTYREENFRLLADSPDRLLTIEGERELLPGLHLVPTGGHTRGHQAVALESAGEVALHMADLLPMHISTNPLWITPFDNFPLRSIEIKEELFEAYRKKGAWFTFYHDPAMLAARFDEEGEPTETFGPPLEINE